METEVLLFEEPTSARDPELVGEVLRVMRALAEKKCPMIVVTHEMGFAREVLNKLMFLHQGALRNRATRRWYCATRKPAPPAVPNGLTEVGLIATKNKAALPPYLLLPATPPRLCTLDCL